MALTRDALASEVQTYARRLLRAYGASPAIGTAFREVWDIADSFVWRSATDRVQVSSSSAQDEAAGTGAKTLVVVGIDGNGSELEQSVTLTGQAPVELPVQISHINRMFVTEAGSGAPIIASNVGDIYASRVGTTMAAGVPTVAGDIYAKVRVGKGRTASLCFVVPAGMSFSVLGLTATVGADARADFLLQWQEPGSVVQTYVELDVKQAQLVYAPVLATKIPSGSRVWLSAKLSTGSDEIHAEIAAVLA